MKNKIHILDCGFGNIQSVNNAFEYLNYENFVINDIDLSNGNISHLVIPGVGNFFKATQKINELNLKKKILKLQENGTLILGICLGMQLLFEYGDEGGGSEGLSFFKGSCTSFADKNIQLPIPNIGFSEVKNPQTKLWKGIENLSSFYFVHSFHISKNVIEKNSIDTKYGISSYGTDFVSYIEKKNIFGCQFHPEKSQNNGLRLLRNFAEFKYKNE